MVRVLKCMVVWARPAIEETRDREPRKYTQFSARVRHFCRYCSLTSLFTARRSTLSTRSTADGGSDSETVRAPVLNVRKKTPPKTKIAFFGPNFRVSAAAQRRSGAG